MADSGRDDTIPASSPPEAAAADEPAQAGSRYRLGAELGRGGMGRVVEAFDTQLGRTVALKEVLPKAAPGAARRFKREVEITARLEHAAIVPLYDSGTTEDGRPYYVMRKVSGRPLDELIAKTPALADRLRLVPDLLSAIDAIAHAHRRGVIHRDLKPANILVGELGETVVIDWGLAKVIGEDDADDALAPRIPTAADSLQTQAGSIFGTPGFMPPEQARGDELGPRSDVFALGATLYTLLVGKPPLTGKSATEMLEATHKHEIVPVADAAPGAPPELVAIVDKALAHEPAGRYANASALAQDVRRFATGQLVAAYNYKRRERLARFARRHRAVLSVSAIGVAIVAVLAWVGVHRVMAERDAANTAKAYAQEEKAKVDAANKQLADHLDAVRVEQAKALLDQNPTMAIALLGEVRPEYTHLDDARAVAQSAAAHGVAWALSTGGGQGFSNELDPAATRLAQGTIAGDVRVFDLESRRQIYSHMFRRAIHASWIEDGKALLVYGVGGPAQIVDPHDGTIRPGTLPAMEWGALDAKGMRGIFLAQHAPLVYDFTTRETRAVPLPDVHEVAIASDGSWYAAADRKQVVVWDRDGKEIARRATGPSAVFYAGKRKLGLIDGQDVVELVLDPAPVWTPVKVPEGRVMQLAYRDDHMIAQTTNAAFLVQVKDTLERVSGDPGVSWDLIIAGDAAVALSSDGKIHYEAGFMAGQLVLPTPVPNARLVGRPGKGRLVIAGDGIVVGFELGELLPRHGSAAHGGDPDFVDDDLVIVHDTGPEWSLFDLAAGTVSDVEVPAWAWGDNYFLDADSERRVLRAANDGAGSHLSIWKAGVGERLLSTVKLGTPRVAVLIPGDAVAFAEGARVLAATGGEAPHEVVTIDGDVLAIAPLGRLRFAALSARGELARGTVAGSIERAHVAVHGGALLAADHQGHALIATGKQLLVWDADVREVAVFDQPIAWLAGGEGGAIVELSDRRVLLVPPTGAPRRLFTAGAQPPAISRDGKVIVTTTGARADVTELPGGASWAMPLQVGVSDRPVALSPTLRRLAAGSAIVWTLPEAKGVLRDWLDEQTDACMAGEALAWPWEGKCQP
jgi:hypothetical protein